MFQKYKDSKQAAALSRREAELATHATQAHDAWERAKLDHGETRVPGVALKKGEEAYLVLNGVGLVEPRRAPSTWVGGSQGVSFRVTKGVRYRVGATRGHLVAGEERPVVIDTGVGVVTNQRMMFVGSKRSTEWAYAKLLGFSLDTDSMAIFNVANRQKASGFGYPPGNDWLVDAVVSAAIAKFQSPEDHAAVVDQFEVAYRDLYSQWDAVNAELAGSASVPAPLPPV